MDNSCLTRPHLESLSTDELIKLADGFGIDIPYGLERIFIIEELLDLAMVEHTEAGKDADGDIRQDFNEVAALPKQYNISFIEVMIRDPLWAFVCWEIKTHDREVYENAPNFEGYCLRVVPLDGKDTAAAGENSFTVPVGLRDGAWYLGFSPMENRRYRVELCCALRGDREVVLAASRSFRLPRLLEPRFPEPAGSTVQSGDIQAVYHNPLACLAGANDFPVTRNQDRQSRNRIGGM
jgi:hypothetical protein